MPYIGKAPSSGIRSRFVYTATGSQTTFTGADDNNKTLGYTDGEYVDVYLNGVLQDPADYTATSKTSVVLDSGATASDIVEIVVYDTFSVFNGTFSGDLTVDGTTLKVDSTNNRVGILTASPATALDVAGTITSDGLTVENTGSASTLTLTKTDGSAFTAIAGNYSILGTDDATNLYFKTDGSFRQNIASNGDISFYEDTGTTAKLFWDASAERLGLGTTSPTASLDIPTGGIRVNSSGADTNSKIGNFGVGGFEGYIEPYDSNAFTNIVNTVSSKGITFQTGGSEAMRLNSTGNLLLRQTSDAVYDTNGAGSVASYYGAQFSSAQSTATKTILGNAADGNYMGSATNNSSGNAIINGYVRAVSTVQTAGSEEGILTFATKPSGSSATERMRILSGGGITFNGDTAAANALDDYEEGTWTPEWQNATNITYHARAGRYQKVGNVCHFSLDVRVNTWTSQSSTAYLEINLPFAVHNLDSTGFTACASWFESGWSYNAFRPEALIRQNSQVVAIYGTNFPDTAENYILIRQDDVTGNGLWVRLQGTYQVA